MAISRHLHEEHTKIVRQVLAFSARTLDARMGVNTTELNALQTTVKEQVGKCVDTVHASLAVLQKMQRELDPSAGAKRTRMEPSTEVARKPSDSAKKQKTENDDAPGDDDEEASVNIDAGRRKAYMTTKPLPTELQRYFKLFDQTVWKVQVLEKDYHKVLNDALGYKKDTGQWQRVLSRHFKREETSSKGWNYEGAIFWLK